MSLPYAFLNHPSLPSYSQYWHEYNRISDLSDWEWYYSGHLPPDSLIDIDGGGILLGGTDATSGSYLNGQMHGATVRFNRLNKLYEFMWTVALSSATLSQCVFGLFDTNTNLLNTCIANGFGMYVNGPSGPATGTWHVMNSLGATVQYTHYDGYAGPVADTSVHTFGITVQMDALTTGASRITFSMDGSQIGNGIAASTANLYTAGGLRPSIAMGNGSAVAQSVSLYQDGGLDRR